MLHSVCRILCIWWCRIIANLPLVRWTTPLYSLLINLMLPVQKEIYNKKISSLKAGLYSVCFILRSRIQLWVISLSAPLSCLMVISNCIQIASSATYLTRPPHFFKKQISFLKVVWHFKDISLILTNTTTRRHDQINRSREMYSIIRHLCCYLGGFSEIAVFMIND